MLIVTVTTQARRTASSFRLPTFLQLLRQPSSCEFVAAQASCAHQQGRRDAGCRPRCASAFQVRSSAIDEWPTCPSHVSRMPAAPCAASSCHACRPARVPLLHTRPRATALRVNAHLLRARVSPIPARFVLFSRLSGGICACNGAQGLEAQGVQPCGHLCHSPRLRTHEIANRSTALADACVSCLTRATVRRPRFARERLPDARRVQEQQVEDRLASL